VERTGKRWDGRLEAGHARCSAELARCRDCAGGGAAENVPVLMLVGGFNGLKVC
jgi:hypothetical protein